MDADEARQLATRAQAEVRVRSYLITIEKVAKDGFFEHTFGPMSPEEVGALKLLGFRLSNQGGNVRVSWGVT